MLVEKIKELRKGEIGKIVDSRISEFKKVGQSKIDRIFSELCFCILTANYSASGGIKIQKSLGRGFLTLDKNELSKKLRELGHRFPKVRAEYIVAARNKIDEMKNALKDLKGEELRSWFVKNIKGLGMKEASHFLRNIGREDYAIIDFHIIDILVREGLIKRPKTLTKKRYIEIENVLRELGKKTSLELGELDIYLWYLETGKILK